MPRRGAAIVSAYTGVLIGNFSDTKAYIRSLPGFEGITDIGFILSSEKIKEAAKADFLGLHANLVDDLNPPRDPARSP